MELQGYIHRRNVLLDMKAGNRWTALEELLDAIFTRSGPNQQELLQALRSAESRKCSAVGRSVTILHIISEKVRSAVVGLGVSRKGIPWEAPDGRVVNIIWLLIHPEEKQGTYLRLLSQAMRICRDPECREKLVNAASSDEVKSLVTEAGARLCPSGRRQG